MMANQIMYSQTNVEDIVSRLRSIESRLNAVSGTLGSVNTASYAGGNIEGCGHISLSGLASSGISGGSVRESVRGFRSAIGQYSSYCSGLSNALKNVSDAFADTENRLSRNGSDAAGGNTSDGKGSGSSGGKNDSGLSAIGILKTIGYLVLWNMPPFNLIMPSVAIADAIFRDMDWSTKAKSEIKLWNSEDGWKGFNIGIDVERKGEKHYWQDKVGGEGKYGSWSDELTVGAVEATGSIGFSLFKDGKLSPDIHAKAKLEGYTFKTDMKGQLGSDEYNVHGSAETKWLGGEAKAEGYAGKDGVGFKAGASAYAARGEIKGGITLFGVKIDVSGGAMVGVEAKAEGKVGGDGVEGKIGLGPLDFGIKIDWSGLRFW